MGVTLQRTAYSTNIKIRRDHTCALFDSDLRHVAQHDIAPQHIGSLVSVVPRNVPDWEDDLEPGDGVLINDPYKGAVHLPDVMLISPLFHDGEIIGYAANSAHHVDIGGGTPGGIPNDSTELYAEGMITPGVHAVEDWAYDEDTLGFVLRNVREPKMRRGDYQAQMGANRIGEQRFAELHETHGRETVDSYLDELLDYTERRVRAAIEALPDGEYEARDEMDGDGVVDEPTVSRERDVYFEDAGFVETPILNRGAIATDDEIEGPAIIEESGCTSLLPPESVTTVSADGNLRVDLP